MELRHAEYFVAVAEEENFTRAAARLRVAQPGISAQIRQLEQELGQTLFDRSTRKVTLTAAGRAILPYFRKALQSVSEARTVADEFSGLVRGRVAVGIITGYSSARLPDLLATFHEKHAGVEIALSEANSDQLVESLRIGQLDLALVGLGGNAPPGIETQVVTDEPLAAAVSVRDPRAQGDRISLKALEGQALICLPKGTGIRSVIEDACASVGFQPKVAFEATSLNSLAQLAIRGLGMAILPASFAHLEGLRSLRIVNPRLRSRIELAWRTQGQPTAAATALLKEARSAFAVKGVTSDRHITQTRTARPSSS